MSSLLDLLLDESKWLAFSMVAACLVTGTAALRTHDPARSTQGRVLGLLSLFFGTTIGAMAFGHLFVVTFKLVRGSLTGSIPLLYLIGVALAAPSWWLAAHSWLLLTRARQGSSRTLCLNAWLAVTLLVLGLHNLPLALPGLLNIAYQLQRRRVFARVIVALALTLNGALLIAALVFFASARSFEEFRGEPTEATISDGGEAETSR